MKTTTHSHVAVLQELLTRLHDSVLGYSKAAELTTEPTFSRFCKHTARERGLLAAELGLLIAGLGGEPDFHGSKDARMHRAWMRFSCHVLPEISGHPLARECQRGEHELSKRLNRLLDRRQIAPRSLIDTIRKQLAMTIHQLEFFSRPGPAADHGRLLAQAR